MEAITSSTNFFAFKFSDILFCKRLVIVEWSFEATGGITAFGIRVTLLLALICCIVCLGVFGLYLRATIGRCLWRKGITKCMLLCCCTWGLVRTWLPSLAMTLIFDPIYQPETRLFIIITFPNQSIKFSYLFEEFIVRLCCLDCRVVSSHLLLNLFVQTNSNQLVCSSGCSDALHLAWNSKKSKLVF